ncbi:MAG: AmmeMemoRadiSam system protein B [Candidatus Micrarchaeota archaeon]
MKIPNENIRYPAVAGAFYPQHERELRTMIDKYLSIVNDTPVNGNFGKLRGLIVPHAGYVYSGPIAAYGYKLLSKFQHSIKNIVMIGPSHHAGFDGACEDGFNGWQTPLGIVMTGSLRESLNENGKKLIGMYPAAHEPEHCLEVQLPFLQVVMKSDFTVYPILTGNIDPKKLAEAISKVIGDDTLIIASSDLSHYLPYEKAKQIDSIANKSIPAIDIETFTKHGDACGKIGILTLIHIAKMKKWKGIMLDYRNSGDTAGPKSRVVGYGCYAFMDE